MELLIEELGQENEFRIELSEYVKDLRNEAKFIGFARWVFGGLAVVACLFCFLTPLVICEKNYVWYLLLPEYPRAALIIGMLAAGVVILQSLVKSVYRSAAERQSDEFVPPQIKLIHDLINTVKPG